MTIVDRYIRDALARGFLIVLLILVVVFSFLDFVEQLDETGQGHYGAFQALGFVIQTTPSRALVLVPVSALLGSLLGFGLLERNSELVALQALGISVRHILLSTLKAAALLLLLIVILGEWVAPELAQRAWRQRALAISGDVLQSDDEGDSFWYRDRNRFINIHDMRYGRIPVGIEIFEFADDGSLQVYIRAALAERVRKDTWLLRDVSQTRVGSGGWARERQAELEWEGFLSPPEGAVTELDVDSLAPSELLDYLRGLRARGQNAERFELALWRKLNIPLAALAMVLLAPPFMFGRMRRLNPGKRLMLGAGVGVGFYLSDQILQQMGLLANADPRLVAMGPAAIMLAAGLLLSLRLR